MKLLLSLSADVSRFFFFSQTTGTFAVPRLVAVLLRFPAPGGRLAPRPVQPRRDGIGRGGRPDLGEGRLSSAGAGTPLEPDFRGRFYQQRSYSGVGATRARLLSNSSVNQRKVLHANAQ